MVELSTILQANRQLLINLHLPGYFPWQPRCGTSCRAKYTAYILQETRKIEKNLSGFLIVINKQLSHQKLSTKDSEALALLKADEYLLHVFLRNYLVIVLGTRLTDRISDSRLYKKRGPIPLSRAIMRER